MSFRRLLALALCTLFCAFLSACTHTETPPADADNDTSNMEEPAPPPKPKLLVVSNSQGVDFIRDAANELQSKVNVAVVKPEDFEAQGKSGYGMIIFDNYQPKQPITQGGVLFFHAVPTGSNLTIAKEPDGTITNLHKPVLTDLKLNHPLMQHLYIEKMGISNALKLAVPSDWQILAASDKGPMIVARKGNGLAEIVVAFEVQETTWPLLIPPTFKTFIANAWQWETAGK